MIGFESPYIDACGFESLPLHSCLMGIPGITLGMTPPQKGLMAREFCTIIFEIALDTYCAHMFLVVFTCSFENAKIAD